MEVSPVFRPSLDQQKPWKAEGKLRHTAPRNFFFLYETLFKILMRLPYGQELWIGFFLSSFEDV
jgi:hypothetical protein